MHKGICQSSFLYTAAVRRRQKIYFIMSQFRRNWLRCITVCPHVGVVILGIRNIKVNGATTGAGPGLFGILVIYSCLSHLYCVTAEQKIKHLSMVICILHSDPLLGITKITWFNPSLKYCGRNKLGYVHHNKLEVN